MAIKLEKTKTAYLYNTEVENLFIAEYMIDAPGEYVKVYLYALMLAQKGLKRTKADLAKALKMTGDDIEKAFRYFADENLAEIRGSDVIISNLKEKLYGNASRSSSGTSEKAQGEDVSLENRPESVYEGDNYRRLLDNKPIAEMTKSIQTAIGRFLTAREKEAVIAMIKDYAIKPDLVAKAYEVAKSRGTDSYKYVGKIVDAWAKQGITTKAEAEAYLAEVDERYYVYRRVMKALGFTRNATEEEKKIISTWIDELGCSMEDILAACAKTAGIGNPNINYVNAVLKNKRSKKSKGASRADIAGYYENLRKEAKEGAERRRQEVYTKVPKIRELEQKLVEESKKLTIALVQGKANKEEQIFAIRKNIELLEDKKTALLTENNIPIDYMNERYRCPRCKDTGRLDSGEQCSCYVEIARSLAEESKER